MFSAGLRWTRLNSGCTQMACGYLWVPRLSAFSSRWWNGLPSAVLICLATISPLAAETVQAAWLRYSRLSPAAAKLYARLPGTTVLLGDSAVLRSAQQELGLKVRVPLAEAVRRTALWYGFPAEDGQI